MNKSNLIDIIKRSMLMRALCLSAVLSIISCGFSFALAGDCSMSFKYSEPKPLNNSSDPDKQATVRTLQTNIAGVYAGITKEFTVGPRRNTVTFYSKLRGPTVRNLGQKKECKITFRKDDQQIIEFDKKNKQAFGVSKIEIIEPRMRASYTKITFDQDSLIDHIICGGEYWNMSILNKSLRDYVKLDCPEVETIHSMINDKNVDSDVGLSNKSPSAAPKKNEHSAPSAKDAM